MTVFFIQFQKELPDFSDAVADPTLYESLAEAKKAFAQASGHRRLYACQKSAMPLNDPRLVGTYSSAAVVIEQV